MFEQSLEALRERIKKLEIELGLDVINQKSNLSGERSINQDSVVAQLATIQVKVKKLLDSSEELRKLPQIIRDYGSEIDSASLGFNTVDFGQAGLDELEMDVADQGEKQERISARLESISLFLNNFTELQSLELPSFPSGLINALDVSTLKQNAPKLLELTQLYEMLVVKNLLVLYRFRELERKESEFWGKVDSRLQHLHEEILKYSREMNPVELLEF